MALKLFWVPPFFKWVAIGMAIMLLAWVSTYEMPPWLLLSLQAAVIATAVFTWTAKPLADLLMLSDPAGRSVLETAHKMAAVGVAALLAAAAMLGLAWAVGAPRGTGLSAILAIFFTVPCTAVPLYPPGRWRTFLAALTVLLAVPATVAVLQHARGTGEPAIWLSLTICGLVIPDMMSEFVRDGRR